MSQPQNPNVPESLLATINPNTLGLDILKILSPGSAVAWRLSQFQAQWYSGSGSPSNVPGALAGNLYIDVTSGNLFLYNGTTWIGITTGGGGGTLFSSGEVVAASGTSFGPLLFTPNGNFFQLVKNGLTLLGGGIDYTLIGNSGTLAVAVVPTDSFVAWYSH